MSERSDGRGPGGEVPPPGTQPHPGDDARDIHVSYVAGLDIGGRSADPDRDPTVLTVARVISDLPNGEPWWNPTFDFPRIEVIKHVAWQASWQRIQDSIRRWHEFYTFRLLAVDSTGIGHYPSDSLERMMGSTRVRSITFTESSKSELCYELRDAVHSGRLKVYAGETAHTRELWRQLSRASLQVKRGAMLMGFHVPDRLGHDDYLISLALCVHVANEVRPRIAFGRSR